jgi:flagellar biosynthetic protein FlhB
MADAQDRNLPASARKISRARDDGQVARSRELGHVAALGIGIGLLIALAAPLGAMLRGVLAAGLRFDARDVMRPGAMLERLAERAHDAAFVIGPLGAVMAVVGIGAALAAGGWNFTTKPLMPKLSKLNPMAGFGRMVSIAQLGDLAKSCFVALAVGATGAAYLRAKWSRFEAVIGMPLPASLSAMLDLVVPGLVLMLLVLAVAAALDLPLQRLLLARRLRMTREEAKQEHKDAEGTAEVKGRIKARMREIARRRMLAAVPKADLVVMNPSHFAVALKYDDATMRAPRVVAKGADLLAFRIRDIAHDAKVPVLRQPPLARALYKHVEIDQEIPAALFTAVAQVLAYVFQLRAARAGHGPQPGEPPVPQVPPELDPGPGATGADDDRDIEAVRGDDGTDGNDNRRPA